MEIYVMHNGEQLGPFSAQDVQAQIDSGNISTVDYAWTAGFDEWKPLSDVLSKAGRDMPRDETPPKQKRTGRTRRALRAIRGFVERRLTVRTVVVVTILLLLASWIYPPWIIGSGRNVSHGWFFVFDTTREMVMRVDFGRLFLIDGIILAVGGLLAWTFFQNSTGRRAAVRIAFYTLVVAPVVGLICFGVVLIQDIQHDVAKQAAQTKRFDPSTATLVEKRSAAAFLDEPKRSKAWAPYDALIAYLAKKRPVTVEIPGHGIAEFPAGMSSAEIVAVIKKQFGPRNDMAFDQATLDEARKSGYSDEEIYSRLAASDPRFKEAQQNGYKLDEVAAFLGQSRKGGFDPDKYLAQQGVVAPDDLKKITLLDAGILPERGWTNGITGFHGRVRNDLPRAVEKIELKASFYTKQGGLIEARTFLMKHWTGDIWEERIFPNAPVSFEHSVNVVDNLPDGWNYQLEVIEAHYVKDWFDDNAPKK